MSPYPEEMRLKGILRRIVQIAKRHRDLYFIDDDQGLAPLSIIITTLASPPTNSAPPALSTTIELDFVVDVLRRMPEMLETGVFEG